MKIVAQKVRSAKVEVNNQTIAKIGYGYLIFLGISKTDTSADVKYLADKIGRLRLCADQEKELQISIKEAQEEILVVSQFTLYASCQKGLRPDFGQAAKSDFALPLYQEFINLLKEQNIKVQSGEFGADMNIELINNGPFTLIIESKV